MALSTTASATRAHTAYRPDIDGLRAVSILLVVTYHAFPWVLGSGYVGVDVFFVISGYLIGGLISAELAAGTFTFAHFYARRVRRIFPALILVLAFVLAVGWCVMFPEEYRLLGRHVLAATMFLSNFPLMGEIGYFSPDAHSKPLLHLWSLGIEEQFYVVWPLIAVLTRRSRRTFLWVTLAVALVSLALSVTSGQSALAFYQPWTRFWELAAGVLLAHLPEEIAARWRASRRLRQWSSGVGLAVIVLVAVPGEYRGFAGWSALLPGYWAMLPVGGAALVIAGGPDTAVSRRLLASPPMVFIGKISYPLYLWHWPLLAFAWIACGSFPTTSLVLSMVAASFVLATLTYFLVERPARFGFPSRRVGVCLPAMVALGIGGWFTMTSNGVPGRYVVQQNRTLIENLQTPRQTRISNGSCATAFGIETGNVDGSDSYVCQVDASRPEILILGDSVSMALHSGISTGKVPAEAVLVAATADHWLAPGCVTPDPLEDWSKGNMICQQAVRGALAILDKTPSIKVVAVTAYSDNTFFNSIERLRQLREAVVARGRKLVLVSAPPAFYHWPEGCGPRRIEIAGIDLTVRRDRDSCEEKRLFTERTLRPQHAAFTQLVREFPDVSFFDSFAVFCDADTCFQWDEHGPLYWSWGHLNERGSVRLLQALLPWLQKTVLDR